jgi:hypothetical protein
MTKSAPREEEPVAAAYRWAAGLVALARKLIAEGGEVDLTPIRPAIRDLCEGVRSLPKNEASVWLARLVELQHELARLGNELAERDRGSVGRTGDGCAGQARGEP